MRLYRTVDGIYVGTQFEAKRDGKGWKLVEVPTDKQGLIDWLNANMPLVHITPETKAEDLPSYTFTREGNDHGREPPPEVRKYTGLAPEQNMLLEIEDFIEEADAGAIGAIACRLVARFEEIKNLT